MAKKAMIVKKKNETEEEIEENEEEIGKKILAYTLENAISYAGRANAGTVMSHIFKEGLVGKENIGSVKSLINDVVGNVNSMGIEWQKKEFERVKELIKKQESKEKKGLPELLNVSKNMVFRLAPYPSGALHIGNAKTYLLNALYAERYKAKLLLVMDDTIGSDEKNIDKDSYGLITDAFDWLNVKYAKPIIYKSDRIDLYYGYAKKMIEIGKAYVCSCSAEELRKNRAEAVDCSCRHLPAAKHLERWEKMFSAKPGEYVLRIKTSMQDKNPAFRDRVLFRISDRVHPRVGRKYNVWPLLEFSWAIDDHLLGITHIIRGKDLMMESEMERLIWEIFGWSKPVMIHSGLVRIEGLGAKISKSKAQKEVREGKFSGWDDPRTWSIQSLRRRGIGKEAIRKFVEEIGLNENDIAVPVEELYAINRKMIDKNAERYFFVDDPVRIVVQEAPNIEKIKKKIHPDRKEEREMAVEGNVLYVSKRDFDKFNGREVRLLHLFNVILDKKSMFTTQTNKNIPRMQWVSYFNSAFVLMEDGTFKEGFVEENVKNVKIGQMIQFERFGFVRLERVEKNKEGNEEYYFIFAHK